MVAVWITQLTSAHGGVGAVSVGTIFSLAKIFFPQSKSHNLCISVALSFQIIVQQKQKENCSGQL